jgi:hypothetical protein
MAAALHPFTQKGVSFSDSFVLLGEIILRQV